MAEYEGEPLEYDPNCLSDTEQSFDTLKAARKWCKEND